MKVLVGFMVGRFCPGGVLRGGYFLAGGLGACPRGRGGRGRFWQPVTHLFLHGGLLHILVNAYMLWALGNPSSVGGAGGLRPVFPVRDRSGVVNAAVEPRSLHAVIGASGRCTEPGRVRDDLPGRDFT